MALFSARRGVRQISWTAVGTPEGMDTHREWLAGQAGGSETARAVYADLLGAVDEKGLLRHEVVVSVTVDRRKLRVRRRPGGLTVGALRWRRWSPHSRWQARRLLRPARSARNCPVRATQSGG